MLPSSFRWYVLLPACASRARAHLSSYLRLVPRVLEDALGHARHHLRARVAPIELPAMQLLPPLLPTR
eukprot:4909276-Prymnesium_polylepis.1